MIKSILRWWLEIRIAAVIARHLVSTGKFDKLSTREKDWTEALAKALIHIWTATVEQSDKVVIATLVLSFLKDHGVEGSAAQQVLTNLGREMVERGFIARANKLND